MGDASDRLAPAHRAAKAGVGANGFDVRCGSELDLLATLEEILDSGEAIAAALLVESGGVGVAIEDATIVEIEIGGDVVGAAPMDEGFFNGLSFRVMTDGAFATVAVEGRAPLGFAQDV
jgi:hypothetical protein